VARPGLRGLSGLKERRPREQGLEAATLTPRRDATAPLDHTLVELERRIGARNAKIVRRWQKRGVRGTSPELLVYDWLYRRRLQFEFQSSLFGGRKIRGGLVCDFVVWMGTSPMAWRVQGEHWHSSAADKAHDKANRYRLLRSSYMGRHFIAVVDLWELDIYRACNRVCEDATRGRNWREV
jgi:hypothetical protein